MIISIHIPKCAGASFLEALKNSYEEKLYLDYAGWNTKAKIKEIGGGYYYYSRPLPIIEVSYILSRGELYNLASRACR